MKTMHYSNPNFNKASELRATKLVINDTDLVLVVDEESFLFDCLSAVLKVKWFMVSELHLEKTELLFLGISSTGKQLWATRLQPLQNAIAVPAKTVFRTIREVFTKVSAEEKALLTYASGLMKWSDKTVFCGVCGSKTRIQEYGHSKICTSEKCKVLFYPQISPAIIVLIEYRPNNGVPECLLQVKRYEDNVRCSTFAGFVEIGESLEDAVKREMKEEVAIDVKRTKYINSQPWVFSASLMLGYYAEVDHKEFRVDGIEIKEAQWFTAKELQKKLLKQEIQLSSHDSISRYLMEEWIQKNA